MTGLLRRKAGWSDLLGWWFWGRERRELLADRIPRALADGALTSFQLARRIEDGPAWRYGPIPHGTLARVLDDLVDAGLLIRSARIDGKRLRFSYRQIRERDTGEDAP